LEGMSLSDYLIGVISQSAERPTVNELRERLHKCSPVISTVSQAKAVREKRDSQYPSAKDMGTASKHDSL
jgi:hypothetical protein